MADANPNSAQTWSDLSWLARVGLLLVIALGVGVAAVDAMALASSPGDGVMLLLILLALATGSVTVGLPRTRTSFSLDTVFVLALLLRGSVDAAVVVSGLSMAVGELRSGDGQRPWHTVPFNFAVGVLAAAVAGLAVAGRTVPETGVDLVGATVSVAFGYYAVNASLVALAITLTRGPPPLALLRALAMTFPAFLGAGSMAALLHLAARTAPVAVLLITPLVVVLYASVHAWRQRVLADERHERDIELLYLPTVAAIASAIEARNAADGGHHGRVQALSLALAEEMGLDDERALRAVRFGALMHDLGRIALPDALLLKRGPITAAERRKLEMHPVLGAELIRHIPFDAPVADTIRYHHERWDGAGYPEGLAGEDIPISARLVAVAEAADSMLSLTPWSQPMSLDAMLEEVAAGAGTRYQPEVAAALPAAVARLGWSGGGREVAANQAVDTIAEGAVTQALELKLARALSEARTTADVLQAVNTAASGLMPIDGWALLQGDEQAHTDATCLEPEMDALVAAARLDPALYDGAELRRAEFDDVQVVADRAGRRAIALPLSGADGWRGALLMRLVRGSSAEMLVRALSPALALPLADALARIWRAERSEKQATTDALTGLGNAMAFEQAAATLTRANEARMALLMLDLDGFKGINDHFGHHIGDVALVQVGRALREVDAIGLTRSFRKGGDEFVVLIEGADLEMAERAATTIRKRIEDIEIEVADGEFLFLRISVGLVSGRTAGQSVEALLQQADEAMYADKQGRKDRLPRGARPITHRCNTDAPVPEPSGPDADSSA